MKLVISVLFLFFSFLFYGQSDTLAIIRHTDSSRVVKKNSKVLYRGILNQLFIEVPNSKSFTVYAEGLKKITSNLYVINVGAGAEHIITIDILLKNNKKVTEKHNFEIKRIKTPVPCFNHSKADTIFRLPKKSFKDGKVTIILPDKNLNFIIQVVGFSIKIPGMKSIAVEGDTIDDKTYQEIIKNSSKGDQIVICEIKMKKHWISHITLNPIVIEVY